MVNRRIAARVAVFAAAYLFTLEVIYLEVANAFLASGAALRLVNRRPEAAFVEWDRAWTWAPGVVHLDGVRVRGQSRRHQWYATGERVRIWVRLLPLTLRHFHARSVHARVVTFDIRRRLDGIDQPVREVEAWPPIPGFTNPPDAAPEKLYPRRRGRTWTITVDASRLEHVRRVWLEEHRLEGDGAASGRVHARIHGSVELDDTRLNMPAARVSVGEQIVSNALDLDTDVSIARFAPKHSPERVFWRNVSGRLQLRGDVATLKFLAPYFELAESMQLDGSGTLDAELRLKRGELQPGTRFAAAAESVSASMAGHELRGSGTVRGSVAPGSPPQGKYGVELPNFTLHRGHDEEAYVHGTGFRIEAVTHGTDLAIGFNDVDLTFDLPASRVARFEVYGGSLPLGRSLRIEGGEGEISGHVEVSTARQTGQGTLDLTGRAIQGRFEDLPLRGDVSIHLELAPLPAGGAPRTAPAFALPRARLELSQVTTGKHARKPWWGAMDLREGELRIAPRHLAAEIEVRMKDTAPIVAVFVERKPVVSLLRSLLSVDDVSATGRIVLDDTSLTIGDFAISGKDTEVLADLHFTGAAQDGLLFAKLTGLTFAVETNGAAREWKLVDARSWFDARRVARGAAAQP